MALIHLCLGGVSPLSCVKIFGSFANFFSATTAFIKQNDSTKQDYNLEGFFPVYFQIYGFDNLIP